MKLLKQIFKAIVIFTIGGCLYVLVELLYRGYSHLSMYFVGGCCYLLIDLLNETIFDWETPLIKQMVISSVIVTVVEFISGLILNVWLGLGVWDYSNLPLNVLGQISLPFMIAWFFLALPAIISSDYARYFLFKEERPHYVWF